MSVIVRELEEGKSQGKIFIHTKGADSAVFQKTSRNFKGSKKESLNKSLEEFSKEGLRTLVFSKREITSA